MSGHVGTVGWKAIVDDSELLPSLRSAFAKLQAEAESRIVKVPLTIDSGPGGRTTFASAQSGASVTPTFIQSGFGGFAANRPSSISTNIPQGHYFGGATVMGGTGIGGVSHPAVGPAAPQAATPALAMVAPYILQQQAEATSNTQAAVTATPGTAIGGVAAATSARNRKLASFALGGTALYEANRLLEAESTAMNPLLNQTMVQGMRTQEAVVNQVMGGLLGGVARSALGIGDLLSLGMGASRSNMSRGFGILGDFSPLAMRAAQQGAERGLANLDVGSSRLSIQAENTMRVNRYEAETRITNLGDRGYQKRREAANEQYDQDMREMVFKANGLQQRMTAAQVRGDVDEVNRIGGELTQMEHDAPRLQDAAHKKRMATLADVSRERDKVIASMRRREPELRARMELQYGRADDAAFIAGQEDELAAADPELRAGISARQGLERGVRVAEIREGIRQRGVGTEILGMQSERRYQDAGRMQINEERRLALQKARVGFFDVGGHSEYFDERPSINAEYDARIKRLDSGFIDRRSAIGLSLQNERALLDVRQRRLGPAVARATADYGSTTEQILSLVQAGEMGLARMAAQNGIQRLTVDRQEFLDSIRGQQVDAHNIDLGNPQDQFSPQAIVKSIDSLKADLLAAMRELVSN